MHPGLVGGLVGGAIGLAGGILGTVISIRSTQGPRERAFLIRGCAFFWTIGLLFIALLLLLPSPYKWFLWIPYPLIFLMIPYGNRRLRQLREQDTAERNEKEQQAP